MKTQQLENIYKDPKDFEKLLAEAEAKTANEWEQRFVNDMTERYDKYGKRMFLSDAQAQTLDKIASR